MMIFFAPEWTKFWELVFEDDDDSDFLEITARYKNRDPRLFRMEDSLTELMDLLSLVCYNQGRCFLAANVSFGEEIVSLSEGAEEAVSIFRNMFFSPLMTMTLYYPTPANPDHEYGCCSFE